MTHEDSVSSLQEQMPRSENACTYDIPLPTPSSGAIPKPRMAMSDQNYRTPEYHDFVRELIELHRPIVKSGVIMVCPVCDRNWKVLDDSTRYLVCSFWSRAGNMGLIQTQPQFSMNVSASTSVTTTAPANITYHNLKPGVV